MTRDFVLDKTTKNTYRFAEIMEDDDAPMVGVIYVQKSALPTKPQRIRVTIEEVRDGS